MKSNHNNKKFSAIVAMALALFMIGGCSSCKKNSNNNPPATQYGSLIFHFHTLVGNVEDSDSTHMVLKNSNVDGRAMKLDFSNMFISNIRLITSAGDTTAPFPDTIILKEFADETYPVGPCPAGNYKTVKFDVGVEPAQNHTNPTMYHSVEPLSDLNSSWYGNQNQMWFGSTTQGYIFANVRGMIDTSAAQNGNPTQPFSYQIGGDALRKTILMPEQDFSIQPNVPQTVHMTIDFGQFLAGRNMKTENICNQATNPGLMGSIANNIASGTGKMFQYEVQ